MSEESLGDESVMTESPFGREVEHVSVEYEGEYLVAWLEIASIPEEPQVLHFVPKGQGVAIDLYRQHLEAVGNTVDHFTAVHTGSWVLHTYVPQVEGVWMWVRERSL